MNAGYPLRPSALFLDFDGVTCDTERAARRSWEELFQESELTFPADLWLRMVGNSAGAALAADELARRRGVQLSHEELARRLRRKAELADAEPACPGVVALLARAVDLDLPVAVVSSSPSTWVRHHLSRLGLLKSLSFVVTGDDTSAHKPAPDLYLLALRWAGVAAQTAVAVEDSMPGVLAAKAAGLHCLAVPNGSGMPVPGDSADAVLNDLEDLALAPASGAGALR
ncbi:HAD family hydrolase [Micromonospora sp. NPDC051227]|uniref:HAD family hydrolase n=1 Tax=Micromonospora sp. NPDC051227 TaxID=3364285 RepID=UPI003797AC68